MRPEQEKDDVDAIAEMVTRMERLRQEAGNIHVDGSAGDGEVLVTMTMDGKLERVMLHPAAVDPARVPRLEALVAEALTDALNAIESEAEERIADLFPGAFPR